MIVFIDADPARLPLIRIRRLRSSAAGTAASAPYQLLYSFIIGFCIEEQAVSQAVAAGDARYSLASRSARVGATKHPLVARAGPEIFSDRDPRMTSWSA